MLNNFTIDSALDLSIPSFELYQLYLINTVAQCILHGEMISDDMALMPSWSKFAEHPQKSKGFFVRILESMFLGKHGNNHLNIDLITKNWFGKNNTKVLMMFLPHQTPISTGNLKAIADIAREVLPAWNIIPLGGGDIRVDGQKINNKNAEKIVRQSIKNSIEKNQCVLILSSQMAQRSFSIPEITELYLAYDGGQAGATVQKMSRTLTPDSKNPNKIGKIISLSLDPNRDDKFDSIIAQTVDNYTKRHKDKSAAEAMSEVLETMDIFVSSGDTIVPIKKDEYMRQLIARKSMSRIIGAQADISKLDADTIAKLVNVKIDYKRATPTISILKGVTKIPEPSSSDDDEDFMNIIPKKNNSKEKLYQLAKEKITAIVDNMGYILLGTGCSRVRDALKIIEEDQEIRDDVEYEFGISVDVLLILFEKVINKTLVELQYETEYSNVRSN